jgi:two-component system chemotaxis response regulator CheB
VERQFTVMVVDDSAFMRKIISDLISEDSNFNVIFAAKNGTEAISKVKEYKPDVITMDINMPEANGFEAIKTIMRDNPTPIIMLSSTVDDGASDTLQALELGAVDFIKKPSGSISLDLYKIKESLLEKLRIAVQTNVSSSTPYHESYTKKLKTINQKDKKYLRMSGKGFNDLVAIGISTGGPKALQLLITQIPKAFPAPILIVQHMPPKFTKSLAQRLDAASQIKVIEAEDQMLIQAGTAYIAPGGWHMTVTKEGQFEYRIRLSQEEPRLGHRPSVDVMYESIIPYQELKRHIVIMTGMGSDGANGMKLLRDAGAVSTIAESQETCVVYGMPRAAVELDAAQYILPLYDIPRKLVNLVTSDHSPEIQ